MDRFFYSWVGNKEIKQLIRDYFIMGTKKLPLIFIQIFWVVVISLAFTLYSAQKVTAFQFPDTGQSRCYGRGVEIACPQPGEPFFGQDAQYQDPQRSYTKLAAGDNELPLSATMGDGWIMTRDNITGLIWELKTADGSIHDADKVYTYCNTNPATNMGLEGTCSDGTDTEDFIATLNSTNFGGHSDWRLPTIKEISSLAYLNSYYPDPSIDTEFFPRTPRATYWTSSFYVGGSLHIWRFSFYAGLPQTDRTYFSHRVMAVR